VVERFVARVVVRPHAVDVEWQGTPHKVLEAEDDAPPWATDAPGYVGPGVSPASGNVVSLPWSPPAFPRRQECSASARRQADAQAGDPRRHSPRRAPGSRNSRRAVFNHSPRSHSARERSRGTSDFSPPRVHAAADPRRNHRRGWSKRSHHHCALPHDPQGMAVVQRIATHPS
jgi:hypothetical protein